VGYFLKSLLTGFSEEGRLQTVNDKGVAWTCFRKICKEQREGTDDDAHRPIDD